jgi:hypothetical protein
MRNVEQTQGLQTHHDSLSVDDLAQLLAAHGPFTEIVLCGSTRYVYAFDIASYRLTKAGYKVTSIGCTKHGDRDGAFQLTNEDCIRLDVLHFGKIQDAHIAIFLNTKKHLGRSTSRELAFAERFPEKRIIFWEIDEGEGYDGYLPEELLDLMGGKQKGDSHSEQGRPV